MVIQARLPLAIVLATGLLISPLYVVSASAGTTGTGDQATAINSHNTANNRLQIAVVKFQTAGVPDTFAEAIAENLRSALAKHPQLLIIERGQIQQILREQHFVLSGAAEKDAVTLGELLGAHMLVLGSITNLGGTISINVRAINSKTGEVTTSVAVRVDNEKALASTVDELASVLGTELSARHGDAEAQFQMGKMLLESKGRIIAKDSVQALRWFRLASDKGHERAKFYVSVYPGPEHQRLRRLAEQGNANAQSDLAIALSIRESDGIAPLPDDAEILKWTRLAAEQGHASAQFSLGLRYRSGHGVPEDKAIALQWLRRAAAQGHSLSIRLIKAIESR